MPRSIIDTESSKGRLVRRRVIFAVVLLVVLLALLFGIWEGAHHASLNLGLREYAT